MGLLFLSNFLAASRALALTSPILAAFAFLTVTVPAHALDVKCAIVHHKSARDLEDRFRQLEVWSTYEYNLVAEPALLRQLARLSVEKGLSVPALSNKLDILLKGVRAERPMAGRMMRQMVPNRVQLRLLIAHIETGQPIGLVVDAFNEAFAALPARLEPGSGIPAEQALNTALVEIQSASR